MPKVLITLLLLVAFCSITKGQVIDTLDRDERISKDTFNMQYTTNIPDGEGQSGTVQQKPVAKEPAVVKDSNRLALENLTRTAVRKSVSLPAWGQVQKWRWWIVPIVMGCFVSIGNSYNFARQKYRMYLTVLQYRTVNLAAYEF